MVAVDTSASYHSEDPWQKISQLRPKLKPHAQFHCHQYRNQQWYILADRMQTNYFRCNTNTYRFVQLLNGQHSIEQALSQINTDQPAQSTELNQEEIIRLLIALHDANLLEGEDTVDINQLFLRQQQRTQQTWQRRLLRPLAIQLPLLDPDRWLNQYTAIAKPFFSTTALVLWLLLLCFALMSAINQWPALSQHYHSRFFDPQNLLWLALLYPLIKALHELGHAFAIKVWGGEVHEMGVLLLVFMPIPYVEASASSTFTSKYRRITVGAAGIMVELTLAASAMLIWTQLTPGVAKDIAFNIAIIGSVSTVLFNGNPLLRFDGYYVLADILEIPNLGSRSQQYIGYLIQRYLLSMTPTHNPVYHNSERGWLLSYAILSSIYRLFISITIILYIAGQFFIIGLILAIWALLTQLLMPAWQTMARLFCAAAMQQRQWRLISLLGFVTTLILVFLFALPITHSTSAKGVITLPEQSLVRAKAEGFVQEIYQHNGQSVNKGDPLMVLKNHRLATDIAILSAKHDELRARYNASLSQERIATIAIKAKLKALTEEIQQLTTQREGLQITSPLDGLFSLAKSQDLLGQFISKGDVIAYVADLNTVNARVVVPQHSVDHVRRNTQRIEVKLVSAPANTLTAQFAGDIPAAIQQLPSRSLGSQGGGDIAVDARDSEGKKTIRGVFQFDISLPVKTSGHYLGQDIRVRFIHQQAPIGWRIYQRLITFFTNKPEFSLL